MKWQIEKEWADRFIPEIKKILTSHAGLFVNVEISSDEIDQQQATDLIITIEGGQVAVRARRQTNFRDWTIRSIVRTGNKTELQKIKEGFARWYLYLWTDNYKVVDWILIDLDKIRQDGILDKKRSHIPNGDGTWFIAIPTSEIKEYLVAQCTSFQGYSAKELLYYIRYGKLVKFPQSANIIELSRFLQLTLGETVEFFERSQND